MLSSPTHPTSDPTPPLLGTELRRLLSIAGPIVVSQLGHIGMGTTDTIMVGPLGAHPLAAAGLAGALQMVPMGVGIGMVMGMSPLVSQAFGAGDRLRCRRVLVQGLWLALGLGLLLVWFSLEGRRIALLLGQDPQVAELLGAYLVALAPGMAPFLLFIAFRQFLEGMSLTRPAMVITFVGLGLNVVANWVLIYGVEGWVPALGLTGSGIATTLVRFVMLLAMALYLRWNPQLHPFSGVGWRLRWDRLREVTRLGTPIGIQVGLEIGLFSFAAVMMGWFGPVELAAHQVVINLASTTFMVALGAGLAGSIRVGQHVGAQRPEHVRLAALATYLLGVGSMALTAGLFLGFPRALMGLYTSDPAIVTVGAALLLQAGLFQVFDGAQVVGVNVLRGAADTRVPMLLCGAGYWAVGVPVAYFLGFRSPLGPSGVWTGLTVGLAAVALLLAGRVRRVLWRRALSDHGPGPLAP